MINGYGFAILSETWSEPNIEVAGYRSVVTDSSKTAKSGRNSGGLALLYKSEFRDWILVEKASPNFLWFKISKNYTKTTKDLFICGAYIPPLSSGRGGGGSNRQLKNSKKWSKLRRIGFTLQK